MTRSVLALSLALAICPGAALACIPPAPPIRLSDESEGDYLERRNAFNQAVLYGERRAAQERLYDQASRVSLARVIKSDRLLLMLADGSPARRIGVQPVAVFKGTPVKGETAILEDAGMTSCGRYGGGNATVAEPGDYVVLFEDANPSGPTGHYGLLLTELVDPRILSRFNAVVREARKAR